MNQCRKPLLVATLSVLALALSGCLEGAREGGNAGSIGPITNPQIDRGNFPLYDPIRTQFPLPEDAVFFVDRVRDGTALNGTDPENPVTQGLGFIDGVSVLSPFDIKISASLDADQALDVRPFIEVETDAEGNVVFPVQETEGGTVVPNPNQNVFLLPLEQAGGDSLMLAEGEVSGITQLNDFRRARFLEERGDQAGANEIYDRLLQAPGVRVELISVDGGSNNAVRLLPERPLAAKTKFAVALSNDIRDDQGDRLVGAPIYQSVSNPARTLSNPQLQPFRNSAVPSRQQVTDFSRFKADFFASRSAGERPSLPSFEDVVYSATFTTTAIDDVLLANAAPITFFDSSLRIDVRQQAIERLVSGFYNLTDQRLGSGSRDSTQDERDINRGIFERLTDENFRLFDQDLADRLLAANENGEMLSFSDVARDSSGNLNRFAAVAAQTAVAEAAEEVRENPITSEADQLAQDAAQLLNIPQARDVRIYNQRDANEINDEFGQSATLPIFGDVDVNLRVFEGEIALPYYMGIPQDEMDGVAIQGSTWSAADFGPNVNLPLTISDRVTYRFPFAKEVGEVKVPIVVTMPDESAPLFTITEPDGGYPVIIYQSALTQDRSVIMPMAIAAGLLCGAEGTVDDCFVTIGIDAPLHGIFPGFEGAASDRDTVASANGGMLSVEDQRELNPPNARPAEDTRERHFSFAANEAMQAVPASQVDVPGSGDLFLNFTNFANTQGHIRQSTLDILNVNASLGNIEAAIADCDNNGPCTDSFDINTDRVYYLTHSLSGVGGVPVPRITNQAIDAGNTALNRFQGQAFLNTGGHITRLLENSPDLAQQVLPGLAVASEGLLAQGRTELNLYFNIFQALLDNVDPANYAASYEDSRTMLTAIVGDPADEDPASGCFVPPGEDPDPNRVTSDCTVPNSADTQMDAPRFAQGPLEQDVMLGDSGTVFPIRSKPAPLAGTVPLGVLMDATNVLSADDTPFISYFTEGSHGNPISAGQSDADAGSSEDVFDVITLQMLEMFLGADPRPVIPGVLASDDDRAQSQ